MNLREIDRLVAEKVMGLKVDDLDFILDEKGLRDGELVNYSTNFDDAWRVVEKMKQANFSARHRFITELQKEVTPKELKDKNQLLDLGWMIFFLTPKAICLAALKTVGVEVEGME
jgi:hypothetical protein